MGSRRVVIASTLLVVFAGLELGVRAFDRSGGAVSHPTCEPRAFTGYAYRSDLPAVDSTGFAGGFLPPPDERVRVAFVGDTLVPPGPDLDPGATLGKQLAATPPANTVLGNWQVAGWTVAEALACTLLTIEREEPDVVLVQLGVHDAIAAARPNPRTDYAHYRRPWPNHASRGVVGRLLAILSRSGSAPPVPTTLPPANAEAGPSAATDAGLSAFRHVLTSLVRTVDLMGARCVLVLCPVDASALDAEGPTRASTVEAIAQVTREVAKAEGASVWDPDGLEGLELTGGWIATDDARGRLAEWLWTRLQHEGLLRN